MSGQKDKNKNIVMSGQFFTFWMFFIIKIVYPTGPVLLHCKVFKVSAEPLKNNGKTWEFVPTGVTPLSQKLGLDMILPPFIFVLCVSSNFWPFLEVNLVLVNFQSKLYRVFSVEWTS